MTITRVVKVGGSLLDWAGLPRRLGEWLDAQPAAVNVLVAGGGKWAEEVREADRRFALGDETAHWLAIATLSVTAKLLAALLPGCRWVTNWVKVRELSGDAGPPIVFDPVEFLREHEPRLPGEPLPHGWCVTSDSIAARLAEALGAAELVLLKSGPAPSDEPSVAAKSGYVDSHFPRAVRRVASFRFVDLRGEITKTSQFEA